MQDPGESGTGANSTRRTRGYRGGGHGNALWKPGNGGADGCRVETSWFSRVFDTDFAADLTIVEEGNELLQRIRNGGVLPMITSCSPGWIKFIEHFYPQLLEHLSTCKSPQQMFGAVAKTYYAEKQVPTREI